MDQFFARILLLNDVQLVGVFILLVAIGGIAGALVFTVKVRFRRVAYLWHLAIINLMLMVIQTGWLAVPGAASAGAFSVIVAFLMLSFFAFGAALYFGSAARSNDIDGSPKSAWLGFIPLANLWLLFTRGQDPSEGGQDHGSGSDALSIVGALLVFGLSQGISKVFESASFDNANGNPALEGIFGEVQTLEERFAVEARVSSRALPIPIDRHTVFEAIKAEGTVLTLVYRLDEEIERLDPGAERAAVTEMCKPEMFAGDLRRGGRIVYVYKNPADVVIGGFDITTEDCDS